jgi:DNA-directed RNA polymerase subunit RPC12/RpoP
MIITYEEVINGKVHAFFYDSDNVKPNCVDCGREIKDWYMHDNYRKRGNYCVDCNAKYLFVKTPSV